MLGLCRRCAEHRQLVVAVKPMGVCELAQAAAGSAGDLGEVTRTKHEQRDHEDEGDVGGLQQPHDGLVVVTGSWGVAARRVAGMLGSALLCASFDGRGGSSLERESMNRGCPRRVSVLARECAWRQRPPRPWPAAARGSTGFQDPSSKDHGIAAAPGGSHRPPARALRMALQACTRGGDSGWLVRLCEIWPGA